MRLLVLLATVFLVKASPINDGEVVEPVHDSVVIDQLLETQLYACAYHYTESEAPMNPTDALRIAREAAHEMYESIDETNWDAPRFCAAEAFFESHTEFCHKLEQHLAADTEGQSFRSFCRNILFGNSQQQGDGSLLERSAIKHKSKSSTEGFIFEHIKKIGSSILGYDNDVDHSVGAPQQESEGPLPICLFMHGTGMIMQKEKFKNNHVYRAGDIPVKKYWGDAMPQGISNICQPKFFFTNTLDHAWDSDTSRLYCGAIGRTGAKIVFTHSMANLLVAHGIKHGYRGCHNIGKEPQDVRWFAVQGPLRGSEAVDVLEDVCRKYEEGDMKSHAQYDRERNDYQSDYSDLIKGRKYDDLIQMASLKTVLSTIHSGYCAGSDLLHDGHKYLTIDYVDPKNLDDVAESHASGSMCGLQAAASCGTSIFRNFNLKAWTHGMGLSVIGNHLVDFLKFGKYGDESNVNDGMVPIGSCALDGVDYVKSPDAPHAFLDINHQDGTCRFCSNKHEANQWYFKRVIQVNKETAAAASQSTSSDANTTESLTSKTSTSLAPDDEADAVELELSAHSQKPGGMTLKELEDHIEAYALNEEDFKDFDFSLA